MSKFSLLTLFVHCYGLIDIMRLCSVCPGVNHTLFVNRVHVSYDKQIHRFTTTFHNVRGFCVHVVDTCM